MVKVTFPDGTKKDFPEGTTAMDIAMGISEGLARNSVAAEIDGVLVDIYSPIKSDCKFKIITLKDKEGIEVLRHSTAHVLAEAVINLFPKAKPTIGPVVEEGFYYDFDADPFSPEDLDRIEAKMKEIIKQKLQFERKELSKAEAKKLFKDNPFKIELIEEMPKDEIISVYSQGKFSDLCRGPHVPNTGMIKAFKLTKLAGAYWKGDAENKQLQRIYGISFGDKKDLNQYLTLLEEAKKRDHRKLGKELDLFSFHEEAPGMPFFHNKGTFIFRTLVNYMIEEMNKLNYEINKTPIILNKSLWLQSGHWDHYKENMYFTKIDKQDYAVKPMNCPGNLLIFKTRLHSYKELPIKAGEFGLVHRHELSGVLSGLFRVRCFTQDDAHIFCTEEQIKSQITELIDLVDRVYSTFDLSFDVELSTKPEKAMGDPKKWEIAEKALADALDSKKIKYKLNPGDGAFYGPKIDFHVKDCLGRTWQCATIQLDFQMPEKFDLTYEGKDGKKHRPVMLHRTIYGAIERFMAVLIEHYAGKFPLWLNPNQVKILTVADRHDKYAEKIAKKFFENNIKVEVDSRAETIGKKVREAQLQQFNYILVVGNKEVEDNTVTVRTRNNEVVGAKKVDEFMKEVLEEIQKRK